MNYDRKLKSIDDINPNSKLYYELGKWVGLGKNKHFVRCGKFKEIENIKEFIEADVRLNDEEFINHHNFVLVDGDMS